MRTTDEHCIECRAVTEHVDAGMMPVMFTREDSSNLWERMGICTHCGGLTALPVDNSQVGRAHQRYLSILMMLGLTDEKELEELGVEYETH